MAGSRAMFWRIVRRQLTANRGRLFVVLLALATGAATTAALLNLQIDAKRRLTAELILTEIAQHGGADGVDWKKHHGPGKK